MSCDYFMCACYSIHGTCRWSGNPRTCAYGKDQREKRLLFLKGYRKGRRENVIKKKLLKWVDTNIHAYNTSDCRWRRRRGVWWDGNYTGVLNILKEIKKTFCSGEKKNVDITNCKTTN